MFVNELVHNVSCDAWDLFTDHKVVTVSTNYKTKCKSSRGCAQPPRCSSVGERYRNLNFHKAPWKQINEEFGKIDWTFVKETSIVDVNSAITKLHKKLLIVLEKLVPIKNPQRNYK